MDPDQPVDDRRHQGIMGHKTIEVTMLVYNHDSVERSKNEVERVASALIV